MLAIGVFIKHIYLQTLCYLLECLITPESVPDDSPRELYELFFVFAAVWAFGGATLQDHVSEAICNECVRNCLKRLIRSYYL